MSVIPLQSGQCTARGLTRCGGYLFVVAALLVGGPVTAAQIQVEQFGPEQAFLIAINGQLQNGDDVIFGSMADKAGQAVVSLNSPGGSLIAGIEIGRSIYKHRFKAVVGDGAICASACALAWLGGWIRFAGATAHIGFHAATLAEDHSVSAPANALVGAYLKELGFSDEAVIFVTKTAPDEISWFDSTEAVRLGIQVSALSKDVNEGKTPQTKPLPPPAAAQPISPETTPPTSSVIPTAPPAPTSLPQPSTPSPTNAAMPAPLEIITLIRPSQIAGLELLSVDTAIVVQRRLLELGYFAGLLDGVWGPKSRIALRDFKASNNLVNDDFWDDSIRSALFSSAANKAPLGYQPPDARIQQIGLYAHFPPPPGASLNPLNRSDAIWLQSRLNYLGYYPRPEEGMWAGIWGEASHNALRDFKTVNGLPGDDAWDVTTESRIKQVDSVVFARDTIFGVWALDQSRCKLNDQRVSISSKAVETDSMRCQIINWSRLGTEWNGDADCTTAPTASFVRKHVNLSLRNGMLISAGAGPPAAYERCPDR